MPAYIWYFLGLVVSIGSAALYCLARLFRRLACRRARCAADVLEMQLPPPPPPPAPLPPPLLLLRRPGNDDGAGGGACRVPSALLPLRSLCRLPPLLGRRAAVDETRTWRLATRDGTVLVVVEAPGHPSRPRVVWLSAPLPTQPPLYTTVVSDRGLPRRATRISAGVEEPGWLRDEKHADPFQDPELSMM
ncbi:hypothetical protein CDD83_5764 [Cordyceps sp. RAO-2017]|nr:hypothetical protein CDD83_5764 [Cordyceps sp. RAO-2017]